jgi:replicative DNA helicase|tara:strand:+ start:2987 stop:4294 length:1308 start_codon:yes stop_codon:yes gene_type:complete
MVPYNKDIEDRVLGGVIQNPGEIDAVRGFFEDLSVISQKKSRILWLNLLRMKRNGIPINLPSVCSQLTDKDIKQGCTAYYITGCTQEASLQGMIVHHASIIYEKYLLRKIIVEMDALKNDALANESDVYDKILKTHSLCSNLINARPTNRPDVEALVTEAILELERSETKLLNTGYSSLDNFAGGLTRGEITIIGGRPGHGKTTFMLNLLSSMLDEGYKVVLFNRELPNTEVIKKLICLESGKLSYGMMRKAVFSKSEVEKLKEAKEKLVKKFSSDKFLMFDNLRNFSKSSAEVKKFKPDVVFDDYIQLIDTGYSKLDRRLQLEGLCNDYKWLAKESNAAIVLASQLNRQLEYRGANVRPQLSDLAESGAIEQVAENVFFTYYDYKVNPLKGLGKNKLQIVASKVRYGDTGDVMLKFEGDKCKISEDYDEQIGHL